MDNKEETAKERSYKNLKPCKKGETHNPKGRPVGSISLTKILERILDNKIELPPTPLSEGKERKSVAEALVLRMLTDALKGNTNAQIELWDRIEGKVRQAIDTTLTGELNTTNTTKADLSKLTTEELKKLAGL